MTQQRIALVTGASRGIGKAILHRLADDATYVIGTATTQNGADAITEQLHAANLKGEGVMMNVAVAESRESVLEDIQSRFGSISILVNNAGITRDNLLLRMKDEEWDELLNTNLTAIFHLSKAVLRGMMKARWGRIISIGSVIGSTGNAGQANYAAAKAGLIGFSKSLAQEIGSRQITVNVIAPGYIQTDMTGDLSDAVRDALLSKIPLQRIGTPEDIAHAVHFLAQDAAGYITGETLHVNGGLYMS